MYKVYYNNRLILISADSQPFFDEKKGKKLSGTFNVRDEWMKFRNDESCKAMWMQGHSKGLWNKFKKIFMRVEAAGGLVQNRHGEYLLIFRNKKWDLPKGKQEKKETIEAAALREVQEECGVSGLSIIKPLQTTYHIYELEGWDMLKHSHWFAMSTESEEELKPQQEEGIEKAVWAKPEQIKDYATNMYPSVHDVLHASGII